MGGSFSVSTSNSYIAGTVQWSEGNINTANNTSDVTATMYLSRTNTGYTSSGTDTFYVTINGTKVSNTLSYKLSYNSNTQMVTATVTVPHNSDGTMNCTIGWGGGGGSGGVFTVNASSGTATLTTIARASTIASNVYWTAGTQNLGVSLNVADSSYYHTLTLETQNSSGTWTIIATRNNIGSSTTMIFSQSEITKMYSWMAQTSYSSATLYVDTYDSSGNHIGQTSKSGSCYAATPSKPSMPSFNNGTTVAISLSPPNSSFTQTITWSFVNYNCTIASGVTASSYNWDTTTNDSGTGPLRYEDYMYEQMPNVNSNWGTVTVTTYYNGQQVQSPQQLKNVYVYVIYSNPTFSNGYTVKDTNSKTVGVTGNSSYIVQNQSTVELDLPVSAAANAINYATMSYYVATLGNTSKKMNVPSVGATLGSTANSGSTLSAATYYVTYTWVDSSGAESYPSPEMSIIMSTGHNMTVTIPSRPSGVSSANIYVSTTSGGEKKQANITGTTWSMSANPVAGVAQPTSMPFALGTLNASSNTTVSVQAVDSRGNSTTTSITVNVIPYQPPVINATATRNNGFDATTTITLSGSFSAVAVGGTTKNSLNTTNGVTYQDKKTTDSSYSATTEFSVTVTNTNYSATNVTLSLDNTASWDILISVADKLTTATAVIVVGKGVPLVFIDTSKDSVGIGMFPVNNNSLETAGSIYSGGDVNATGTLQQGGNELLPPGTVTMYGGTTAPAGWLFCGGGAVSRTTYSRLFAAIGTGFGAGDGSTTFNLPNLAGRMPIGFYSVDSDFASLGNYGGEKNHTLTTAEMPPHTHQITTNSGLYFEGGSSGHADGTTGYATQASTLNTGSAGGSGGSTTAHNNMPPYVVINFIIKT